MKKKKKSILISKPIYECCVSVMYMCVAQIESYL